MQISLHTQISTLPPDLADFLKSAGAIADAHGQKLYLVGGVVRDLLLKRPTFDIDLVVEGDALSLIQNLPQIEKAKVTRHPRFGTAKLKWQKWSIDFTTARSETYARPGALPAIKPGSLKDDLFRRDFTVNAMAVHLGPGRFGELVDLYGGMRDLEQKLIRVLHDNSFVDDATRIWRAVRYEQRLDFSIEPHTLELLKGDVPLLDTITGDRVRYEVECVLAEEYPEKALRRADELGVLRKLNPALQGDGWLAQKCQEARELHHPPPIGLYMALLTCRLDEEQAEAFAAYLNLPRSLARIVRDTVALRGNLELLADPAITLSRIYRLLRFYPQVVLTASSLSSDSPVAREHIRLFASRLRYIAASVTGDDLISLGIPPGPQMREVLERLRDARLDGRVTSRQEEVEMVKAWLRGDR